MQSVGAKSNKCVSSWRRLFQLLVSLLFCPIGHPHVMFALADWYLLLILRNKHESESKLTLIAEAQDATRPNLFSWHHLPLAPLLNSGWSDDHATFCEEHSHSAHLRENSKKNRDNTSTILTTLSLFTADAKELRTIKEKCCFMMLSIVSIAALSGHADGRDLTLRISMANRWASARG